MVKEEITPGPHGIFVNAISGVMIEQEVNIEEAAKILEKDFNPKSTVSLPSPRSPFRTTRSRFKITTPSLNLHRLNP